MAKTTKTTGNPQETDSITAEMVIVPQGQMVKPRKFIVRISKDPLRQLIKKEVINSIMLNSEIKRSLRRA